MGLTRLNVRLRNLANAEQFADEELLVDSGAIYSIVPAAVLRRIGIQPHTTKTFTLADGSHVDRDVGNVSFEVAGSEGAAPVIFGRRGDVAVLGALTLEALGLMLDPLKREIRPMALML
jgi:predicted aspartyl protease